MANEVGSLPAMSAASAGWAGAPYAAAGSQFVYDENGNRIASGWDATANAPVDAVAAAAGVTGLRFKYVYDAWNRLVEIKRASVKGGTPTDDKYRALARYRYNGLNWRTSKLTVSTVGGPNGAAMVLSDDELPAGDAGLVELRTFWYDAALRAVAEDVDMDAASPPPTPPHPTTTTAAGAVGPEGVLGQPGVVSGANRHIGLSGSGDYGNTSIPTASVVMPRVLRSRNIR
jgi:hypothetical protein